MPLPAQEQLPVREVGVEFMLEHRIQRASPGRGEDAWVGLFDQPLSAARWLARALGQGDARTLRGLIASGALVVTSQRPNAVSLLQPELVGGAHYRWTLRRDGDELSLTIHCEIEDPVAYARWEARGARLHSWLRRRLMREATARVRVRRGQ